MAGLLTCVVKRSRVVANAFARVTEIDFDEMIERGASLCVVA